MDNGDFFGQCRSYPRIGDQPKQQRLRKAYGRLELGEITEAYFEKVQQSVVKASVREQEEAGLDLVTDGQIRWYDPVSHLAGKLEGVKINGLLRFFDTNFYFRQPIITAKLGWKGLWVQDEFIFQAISKQVKRLDRTYTLLLSIVQTNAWSSLRIWSWILRLCRAKSKCC
jgi:methionine synthase II (cobalamin-independent)